MQKKPTKHAKNIAAASADKFWDTTLAIKISICGVIGLLRFGLPEFSFLKPCRKTSRLYDCVGSPFNGPLEGRPLNHDLSLLRFFFTES